MKIRQLTLATIVLLTTASAHGQYIKVAGKAEGTALYINTEKVWDYNLYEHSRWGGGLRLVAHPAQTTFKEIAAEAYLGYGVFDEQWKYGAVLTEKTSSGTLYQCFVHDYFATGSRRLTNPWDGTSQMLPTFWARRMTDESRVNLGHHWRSARLLLAAEAEWRRRGMLFDGNGLLYVNQGEVIDHSNLVATRLMMRHNIGFSVQLELGYIFDTIGGVSPYLARMLTCYNNSFHFSPFTLYIYVQAGITPQGTSYVDMFDLGGTYGVPLLIGNNLAIARPNEFTANVFGLFSILLKTMKPLYKIYSSFFSVGSNPMPFVGINAAWGHLWGQAVDGSLTQQGISMQAPCYGIAEPVAGVNGLIRWGAVDWGIAAAYRLVPKTASYHFDPHANLTLLFTANLIL